MNAAAPGATTIPEPSPVARAIGRTAIVALYHELALAPKPGLVSFVDAGSHGDMNASTFLRSLFALRRYYVVAAALGECRAAFDTLERVGISAETRMLAATGGINTHRGAVFMLGLLCAAAGAAAGRTPAPTAPAVVRRELLAAWGEALHERCGRKGMGMSKGMGMGMSALRDAGAEAALGFPIVFECALPALQRARAVGLDERHARLQALFETMALLDDTNLVRRGGLAGLAYVRDAASRFLNAGGAGALRATERAFALHDAFVARNLSPGGSADVLAAAVLLDHLTRPT